MEHFNFLSKLSEQVVTRLKPHFTPIHPSWCFVSVLCLLLTFGVGSAWGATASIIFGDLGLTNGVQYSDPFEIGQNTGVTIQFGGGGNDGKYYTTGSGIRTYGGGTVTVDAGSGTLTNIVFTFSEYSYAAPSKVSNVGTYTLATASGTWTGSASSVTLTRGSGSGHWRLQSVSVTYTPVAYTVTFNAEGGTFPNEAEFTRTSPLYQIDEATGGAGITLPHAAPSAACASEGWGFYGWATSAVASETATAPTIVGQAGDMYYPSNNTTTLHAVFAKGEYTKITSTSDLNTTSRYFFAAVYSTKNYVMTNKCTSNKLAAKQINETSSGKYHAAAINAHWCYTLESSSTKWWIKDCNPANSYHYLDTYYEDWYGHKKDNLDLYTFTYSSAWTITNSYGTNKYFGYSNSDAAFKTFSSSKNLLIYKETTTPYYCSTPSCCTELGTLNGSVSWSNDGTSLTVKNWGYTQGTGAAESNISKYTVYLYSDNDSYAASIANEDCTVANRASTGVTFDNLSYTRTYKVKITATPADGYCPVDDVWSSDTYTLTCATPTAATAGSFNRTNQQMPISWTSGAGKVDICYSSSSSTPGATPGDGYTVVSNQTSSPVNLSVSGLAAGNYYCWVRSVCDASNKSNWTAITGSTFTIPAHTLTITKDGGGSSTITPASGSSVVEGRTSSITASPATGFAFDHWAVSGTNATLSSTSTNPTTFTMGTANATVTGYFTCVEPVIGTDPADADYYVGDSPTALEVAATLASGTRTYLWKVSTNGGSTWSDAEGTNNEATYSGASLSTASVGTLKFKCIVGNSEGGCTVESGVATITVANASYFPNGKTIFIQAYITSAWDNSKCVKAWFHTSGGSETAQSTYWLFDATGDDNGKKLFAAVVPASGDLPYLDIQRFESNCNDWKNKNGGCSFADAAGSNIIRSTGSTDTYNVQDDYIRWNATALTMNLMSSVNWNSSVASVTDQGSGVWSGTYEYTPTGTSTDYVIATNYNGNLGNTGVNPNATLSGMIVGSTYNVTATFNVISHTLAMSKEFVKGEVSFDLQGHGDAISKLTNVTAGSTIAEPSEPSATGYTFGGWFTDPECTDEWTFATDEVSETMTLYAKWTANVYTITPTFSNVANAGLPASFTYTGSTTTGLNSTFTVNTTNFFLPSSIAVTMGGATLTAGTDYTYNNSTGAFTFSAVITGNIVITAAATAKLKSIAITTQPTTRKYLVGETFSSTGAVVTATMGDGSTKPVSVTWDLTTLTAGAGQTVTASYSEGGIDQTATTTVDVYSVTVNKVAASDGSSIDAAGVTATCTTRALAAGVSTTNYTFKNWEFDGDDNDLTITSTTSASTTLTGTPTGNVTIKAIFYKPITVTWKVGNNAASGGTSEVKYNTKVASLPTQPDDDDLVSCIPENGKFMGWTASGKIEGSGHDAPADLFTSKDDAGCVALTENTTYRAVFATQSGGGTSSTSITTYEDGDYYIVDTRAEVVGGFFALNGAVVSDAIAVTDIRSAVTENALTGTITLDLEDEVILDAMKYRLTTVGDSITIQHIGTSTSVSQKTNDTKFETTGTRNWTIEKHETDNRFTIQSWFTKSGTKTSCLLMQYSNWNSGTQQQDLTLTAKPYNSSNMGGTAAKSQNYMSGYVYLVPAVSTTYSDYITGCCSDAELAYSPATETKTFGDAAFTKTLTNTHNVAVTYALSSVSPAGCVTINSTTGQVSIAGAGSATVTASSIAQEVNDISYCADEASYTLTVNKANITPTLSYESGTLVIGDYSSNPTIGGNTGSGSVTYAVTTANPAGCVTVDANTGVVTAEAEGTATITATVATTTNYNSATVTADFTVTCGAPSSVDISGAFQFYPGETISLTATPTGGAGTPVTYQWKKDGVNIVGATSATYTKNNATAADAGAYTCTVQYGSNCATTSANFNLKCMQFYLKTSLGADIDHYALTKVDATHATLSLNLAGGTTYNFRITDGCNDWYGNSDETGITSANCNNWTMPHDADAKVTTGTKTATYTFNFDFTAGVLGDQMKVSVVYPSTNQASGKVIYWDNEVNKWDGSKLWYRIGKSNNNLHTQLSKVAGTANFYSVTTSTYDGFDYWHIANNEGQGTGNIYWTKDNSGSGLAITNAMGFEGAPVTEAATTVTPTTTHTTGTTSDNDNCEFYTYSITTGMKTYTVASSGTNCTVTMEKYNDDAGTSTTALASGGTVMPTQYIKVTVTPTTGYQFSSVVVTNGTTVTAAAAGTPGVYYITGNATVTATCTVKSCSVNFEKNSGTGGDGSTTATYGSAMTTVTTPTRTGYTFDGYWDGAGGTGTQYYLANGTSARNWDKDVTAAQTLYAKWNAKQYTIELDREGAASGAESVTATFDAGTLAGWSAPSKTGYEFGGYWSADNGTGTMVINASGVLQSSVQISSVDWTDASGHWIKDGGVTVYAKWTAEQYTITYKDLGDAVYSGSNLASLPAKHTYGAATDLVDGVRSGYRFDGWFDNSGCTGDAVTTIGATAKTAAFTLYAKWTQVYTVTWHVGNGTWDVGEHNVTVDNTNVVSGGQIDAMPDAPADNTLSACASKFMGWSKKSWGSTPKGTGTGEYDDLFTDVAGSPYITQDTTFYAVFAEQTNSDGYKYIGDDGTLADGKKYIFVSSKTAGSAYALKATDLAAPNSGNNGTAVSVTVTSNSEGILVTTVNTALEFEYVSSGSKLQYEVDGPATRYLFINGDGVGMKSDDSRSRYTTDAGLQGWNNKVSTYYDVYYNSTNEKFEKKESASSRVYAFIKQTPTYANYRTQCDANLVKVTYDANGGSTTCADGSHDKRNDYTVCATEPTRDYYTFAGWLCSADDEVYLASATIDDAVIDADFSLTAQWTPVPYDITYNLYGGTNSGSNPATYNVATATITLQAPTKGHDRFEGWFSTYSAGVYSDQVTSIPLGSHGDISLHAKWAERHEIIFDADGTTTTIYRADDEDLSASVAGQGSVPDDPDAPSACSTKVFVGWSESEIDDETDDEPADLMKPAAGTVDEDKHYYAVWANESSESGQVKVFEDTFYGKAADNTAVSSYGKWTLSTVFGTGTSSEGVRLSSGSYGASMTLDLSDKTLESTLTIKFKIKKYSSKSDGTVEFDCLDAGATPTFTPSTFNDPTASWVEKTCTVTGVDNKVKSITINGITDKQVLFKDFVITQTGTVYSYSAYSTSCCATKVTLSQNDPENGTIAFGKTSVGTCGGDKDVSLTITPAAGYQLATYSVATGDGKVATKNVSPDIALNNNSNAAQNITLTFASGVNGAYDVTASFSEMIVTSWSWTNHDGGAAVTNTPFEIYVGQSARVDVAYNPSSVLSSHKNYSRSKDDTYINWPGGAQPSAYCTFIGKATTGENTTTITLTHSDAALEQLVYVKVLPLPLVHFEDLVHGKAFADVAATIVDNALSATKTTPTSDDWTTPNANDCEGDHLHLVGWIREDWPALVAYLNGTGDAPTTTAITGAGNDGSGNAYFFTAGASFNVQTFDGVTFYAVWAQIE